MIRLVTVPLAAAVLLGGCATHRVMVGNPNPSGPYQTVQSTAYAGVTHRIVVDCPTNLIDEVRVRQSLAESFVTVLTLGLVAPAQVTYRCAKAPTEEGGTGN
jgi:hypothetical protein